MRRAPGVTVAVIVAFVSSGCLFKGYREQPSASRYHQDYYEAAGDPRVIPVGEFFEAQVVPGTDLTVRILQRPVCRQALIGRIDEKQQLYRERSVGLSVGLLLLGIPLLIIPPVGLYMLGARWWIHKHSNITVTRVVSTQPAAVWASDVEPCPGVEPSPASGRMVRVAVTFPSSHTYQYDGATDGLGQMHADHAISHAARLATMCGAATITIDDVTPDPGYVVPKQGVEWRTEVGGEVVSGFDTGTPAAIHRIATHTAAPPLAVQADGSVSYDGLYGLVLEVAQACSAVNAANAVPPP